MELEGFLFVVPTLILLRVPYLFGASLDALKNLLLSPKMHQGDVTKFVNSVQNLPQADPSILYIVSLFERFINIILCTKCANARF